MDPSTEFVLQRSKFRVHTFRIVTEWEWLVNPFLYLANINLIIIFILFLLIINLINLA